MDIFELTTRSHLRSSKNSSTAAEKTQGSFKAESPADGLKQSNETKERFSALILLGDDLDDEQASSPAKPVNDAFFLSAVKLNSLGGFIYDGLLSAFSCLRDENDQSLLPLLHLLPPYCTDPTAEDLNPDPLSFLTFLTQSARHSGPDAAASLLNCFVEAVTAIIAQYNPFIEEHSPFSPSFNGVCDLVLDYLQRKSLFSLSFHFYDTLLLFLCNTSLHRAHAAAKLIVSEVFAVWQTLFPINSERGGGQGGLLLRLSFLQICFNLLHHTEALQAFPYLLSFTEIKRNYRTLPLWGAMVLRTAVFALSCPSPGFAKITQVVLQDDWSEGIQRHSEYLERMLRENVGGEDKGERGEEGGLRDGDAGEDTEGDADPHPLLAMSKEQCEDYLGSKPAGTFLLRLSPEGEQQTPSPPRSNNSRGNSTSQTPAAIEQQLFLNFKTSERAFKHAVIRREDFGEGVVVFRCGAVGPFPSLSELLSEISQRLPQPLLFAHSSPAPSSTGEMRASAATEPANALNTELWNKVYLVLPGLLTSLLPRAAERDGEEEDEEGDRGGYSDQSSARTAVSESSSGGFGELEEEGGVKSVDEGKREEADEGEDTAQVAVWQAVLLARCYQSFCNQVRAIQTVLQIAYSLDLHNAKSNASDSRLRTVLPIKAMFHLSGNDGEADQFSTLALHDLLVYSSYLHNSATSLIAQSPRVLLPAQYKQFKEEHELLHSLERLLLLLIQKSYIIPTASTPYELSAPSSPLFKTVKFPSPTSLYLSGDNGHAGYSGGSNSYYALSDCCDSTELLHVINQYIFDILIAGQSNTSAYNKLNKDETNHRKDDKYSMTLYYSDSDNEPMHYVDLDNNEDDDSNAMGNGIRQSNRGELIRTNNQEMPIDFVNNSPVPRQSKAMEGSTNIEVITAISESSDVEKINSVHSASSFIFSRNTSAQGLQSSLSVRNSNSSFTLTTNRQSDERTASPIISNRKKSNIGDIYHNYLEKMKGTLDDLSHNIKSNLTAKSTSSASHNNISNSNAILTLTHDTYKSLLRLFQILNIDVKETVRHTKLDNPSSCFTITGKIVDAMLRFHLLVQVIKPSELAFGLPQTYYHYIDDWESNVIYDHTVMASEKCRVGRYSYRGMSSSNAMEGGNGQVLHNLQTRSRGKLNELLSSTAFTQLFLYLRVEDFVIQSITQANLIPAMHRHTVSSVTASLPFLGEPYHALHPFHPVAQSPYLFCLEHYLYRNALFRSLRLNYRFIAVLQVDLYHLKEILAVVNTAKPTSVTGQNYNNQAGQVILTPVQHMHTQSLDVYSAFKLNKLGMSSHTGVAGSMDRVSSNNMLSDAFFSTSQSNSTTSKYSSESCSISPARRIEASRTTSSTQPSSSTSNASALLPQISHATDYDLRLQTLFHLPLPEHIESLMWTNGPASSAPLSLPYTHLTVSVVEKSFFSDVKIGDVTVSLLPLHDKTVLRDWFPLTTGEKGGGSSSSKTTSTTLNRCPAFWLAFLQVKLRLILMQKLDEQEITESRFSSSSNNAEADNGKRNMAIPKEKKKSTLLGHLEDFF